MLSFHLLWALRGFESNAQSVGKERRFRSFSSSEYCYLVSWQRWFFIVIEILNKVNPPLSWWSARFFTSLENKWKYSYKATATLRFRSVVASLAVQLNALVFQIWNLSDGLKKFKEERKKKRRDEIDDPYLAYFNTWPQNKSYSKERGLFSASSLIFFLDWCLPSAFLLSNDVSFWRKVATRHFAEYLLRSEFSYDSTDFAKSISSHIICLIYN